MSASWGKTVAKIIEKKWKQITSYQIVCNFMKNSAQLVSFFIKKESM